MFQNHSSSKYSGQGLKFWFLQAVKGSQEHRTCIRVETNGLDVMFRKLLLQNIMLI